MATYSQSLGTFYGYANGNAYGRYNCYLEWNGTTRSGSVVTLHDAQLRMTKTDSEKYTTNRIATRIYVAGTMITPSTGATLSAYQAQSGNPLTYNIGDRQITTNATSFTVRVEIASTGANSGWTHFQSTNVDTTVTISCPSAYPTYTTAPSVTNVQENSVVINRGATDISSKFYYKLSTSSSWTELTKASTTISGLAANTKYTFNFKAVNATDSSLEKTASNIEKTTYQYPYITSVDKTDITIGETQTIEIYNPLGRTTTVYMTHSNRQGETIYSAATTGTRVSFTVPIAAGCSAIGSNNTSGTAFYYCLYNNNFVTNLTGTYKTSSNFKPTWGEDVEKLFTYKDGNTTFVDTITQNNQNLVQQFSQLFYGVNYTTYPAQSSYAAIIDHYEISINNGGFVTIPSSSATATVNANYTIPASVRSVAITLRAIDSRGYISNSLSKTLYVSDYKAPGGSVEAARVGGYGTTVTLSFYPVWGINQNNAGTATYSYCKNGDAYSEAVVTSDFSQPVTFTDLSNEDSFTFKVIFTDKQGLSGPEIYSTIGIGEPILFIDSAQTGVGVNCFPEGKGLYVRGEAAFHDNIKAKTNLIVQQTAQVKGSLETGAHRIQTMTRNGEVRTGFFYIGGSN